MLTYPRCKADPSAPDFVKKFEELHPEFKEELYFDKVQRRSFFSYVVLTYDVESPFVIKYKDWATRRRESSKLCAFPKEGIHYTKEVENIILGKNPRANKIILRYLFLQNDVDFLQFQSYQSLFYRQLKESMEKDFDNPGHYEKLKKNIDTLASEIKSLQKAIFNGDESKELKKALYDFVSKITLDFRPEHRASRIEDGEPVVDDKPYPDDYEVDEMTFNNDE